MDDRWRTKSKSARITTLDVAQALYSAKPTDIKPIASKRPKAARSSSDPSNPTEAHIQSALVKWARSLGLPLISIPNHGKRSAWQGMKEKACGLTPGVSDLFLARPSMSRSGMWIELKSKGRTPTVDQYDWLNRMEHEGYRAVWHDNLDDAISAIKSYLGMI